jgi:hypothetical protein
MKRLLFLVVFMLAPIAAAQKNPPAPGMTRILVPTVARSTPGAFGSIWVTEFAVVNSNSAKTFVEYPRVCPADCSFRSDIESGAYRDITDVAKTPSAAPGIFLYVPTAAAPLLEFSLRVRNLAVQSRTWGAEVPVVRESEAFTRPFSLLNVPIDARFRHLLRVYDFAGETGVVRVEYLSIPAGTVLFQANLALFGEAVKGPSGLAYPAYGSLTQPREIASEDRVRMRITPLDASQRLWAFVSFTNNETQEVTNISPQQ